MNIFKLFTRKKPKIITPIENGDIIFPPEAENYTINWQTTVTELATDKVIDINFGSYTTDSERTEDIPTFLMEQTVGTQPFLIEINHKDGRKIEVEAYNDRLIATVRGFDLQGKEQSISFFYSPSIDDPILFTTLGSNSHHSNLQKIQRELMAEIFGFRADTNITISGEILPQEYMENRLVLSQGELPNNQEMRRKLDSSLWITVLYIIRKKAVSKNDNLLYNGTFGNSSWFNRQIETLSSNVSQTSKRNVCRTFSDNSLYLLPKVYGWKEDEVMDANFCGNIVATQFTPEAQIELIYKIPGENIETSLVVEDLSHTSDWMKQEPIIGKIRKFRLLKDFPNPISPERAIAYDVHLHQTFEEIFYIPPAPRTVYSISQELISKFADSIRIQEFANTQDIRVNIIAVPIERCYFPTEALGSPIPAENYPIPTNDGVVLFYIVIENVTTESQYIPESIFVVAYDGNILFFPHNIKLEANNIVKFNDESIGSNINYLLRNVPEGVNSYTPVSQHNLFTINGLAGLLAKLGIALPTDLHDWNLHNLSHHPVLIKFFDWLLTGQINHTSEVEIIKIPRSAVPVCAYCGRISSTLNEKIATMGPTPMLTPKHFVGLGNCPGCQANITPETIYFTSANQ